MPPAAPPVPVTVIDPPDEVIFEPESLTFTPKFSPPPAAPPVPVTETVPVPPALISPPLESSTP